MAELQSRKLGLEFLEDQVKSHGLDLPLDEHHGMDRILFSKESKPAAASSDFGTLESKVPTPSWAQVQTESRTSDDRLFSKYLVILYHSNEVPNISRFRSASHMLLVPKS